MTMITRAEIDAVPSASVLGNVSARGDGGSVNP
jgi:hypothetical protein